jgi:hypothetical protein
MGMDKYSCTVAFVCNGKEIDDFKTYTEDARALRKAVQLMKKTGIMKVTPRYGFSLAYVVPRDEPEFDFDSVEDGTVVIEHDNGGRTTFTGCSVLEVGEEKYDGENEPVKDIKFIAAARIKE